MYMMHSTIHHGQKTFYLQYLYSSIRYSFNVNLKKIIWFLSVDWFRQIVIIIVFFLLPWRWTQEWPKHVSGYYTIKSHLYTKVHLLVFLKFHTGQIRFAGHQVDMGVVREQNKTLNSNLRNLERCCECHFSATIFVPHKTQLHKDSRRAFHFLHKQGCHLQA
jgi:hypothetical protein